MTVSTELELKSFVLLRLGDRRFAVAADQTAELVAPSRVFRFPHRTPKIEGVILRRGRIVPVCDVAEKLIGKYLTSRRFYLIALRRYGPRNEWVALPVTGECELINAGWLSHAGDVIEVLSLDALTPGPDEFATSPTASEPPTAQPTHRNDAEARP